MHLANTSASMARNTRQHSLGAILLYRLLTFPRCTTERPEEADLFVIPMLITAYAAGGAEESNKVWSKQAPSVIVPPPPTECRLSVQLGGLG